MASKNKDEQSGQSAQAGSVEGPALTAETDKHESELVARRWRSVRQSGAMFDVEADRVSLDNSPFFNK